MWKFYKAVMQSAIKEFWTATDQVLTAVAVLSFFGILANRKYAERIVTAWNGISPWWSTIPIFLLVVYRLLRANYEKYSRVKAALDALTSPFAVAEEDPRVYLRPLNDQFVARGLMAFEVLNDGQRVNPAEEITVQKIPSLPHVRFDYIDVLRANDPKIIVPKTVGDDLSSFCNILSELDKAWTQAWEAEESKNEVMLREAEFPFEIKINYKDSKLRTYEATTSLRYCPIKHRAALSGNKTHGDIIKVVPSAEPRFRRLS